MRIKIKLLGISAEEAHKDGYCYFDVDRKINPFETADKIVKAFKLDAYRVHPASLFVLTDKKDRPILNWKQVKSCKGLGLAIYELDFWMSYRLSPLLINTGKKGKK